MKKLLAFIILALALVGCATAPLRPTSVTRGDYDTVKEYATRLIQHEMDRNKVVGLSIALVDDQHIIWAEGFGYSDQENKIPATADTLYRVGSISKLFTDTAAMQLMEQGRLDIDAPLQSYLPNFSIKSRLPDSKPITPRLLMTHHAGLPRDIMKGLMGRDPMLFTQFPEALKDKYINYPPDTVFSYSNLGVGLLGDAIQKVSGVPYVNLMQRYILSPLNMQNSSFEYGLSDSTLMAKGYRGLKAANEPKFGNLPAGGLNSSVNEMSHFVSMVFAGGKWGNQQILKAETVREMLRPQNTDVPLDLNFHVGIGWMLSTLGKSTIENAGPVAHHNGATLLFNSSMYLLPAHRLGVIVLANSNTAKKVVDHVASETLSLALEAKTGIRQPTYSRVPADDGAISAAALHEYAGDYATVAGLVKIYAKGKELRAVVAGHDLELVQRKDGMFGLDYTILGFIHVYLDTLSDIGFTRRTVAGRDVLVARLGKQELLVGQKIKPPVSVDAWKARLGDYEITNLDGDYQFFKSIQLAEEDGFLLFRLTTTDAPDTTTSIPLMPVSEKEGILLGALSDGGQTIRSEVVNGEERLVYSGYFLKKRAE